jgi:uncharacterized coiled-coil protein SlyX
MKNRRFASILVVAGCAMLVFVLSSKASDKQSSQQNAKENEAVIQELKDKVVKLEAQVAELQKQLDEIRKKSPHPYFAIPEPNPKPKNPIPHDWKPFNFNGQRYYIVPLNQSQLSPAVQNLPSR